MIQRQIQRTSRLRAIACWIVVLGMLVCSWLARPATRTAAPSPRPAGAMRSGYEPPSCLGATDLLVSGMTIAMSGTEALNHLCVTHGDRILGSGDLSLTVGMLYVNSSSAISMDGHDGGIATTHDCNGAGAGPNGAAGYSLAIAAYQVRIEGALSAAKHFPRLSRAGVDARFFAATGHSLGGRFLAYWLDHRGSSILGALISEPLDEGNGDGSGRRYLLQWFERGRLEYHPENAGTYAVELGLVGRDALRTRGWLPPQPPPAASALPANSEAGRVPGARLYVLEANGDIFASDGSRAWRYRSGSVLDPAQCSVTGIASTADGAAVYVPSVGAQVGGLSSA